MIYANGLSIDEEQAVEEIQLRMENELPAEMLKDVHFLWSFLKARNFDVEKAENMLRKHLSWRKALQVDTILEDFKPKECFLKYINPNHIGYDKDGDPVRYSPIGKIEGRDAHLCITTNHYMKHWAWMAEKLVQSQKQLNEKRSRERPLKLTLILNLDQCTLANATNKYSGEHVFRIVRLLTDNYPEALKAAYVINAPSYYVLAFSLIRPLLSKEMIRKFHVFGRHGFKEKLLEAIDADVLPAFLGGNRTDPDGNPLCKTIVHHGGRIPKEYYITDEERWFEDVSRVKKIHVCARGKESIFVDMEESGSLIQWEFMTNGKDIGFGLFFKAPENGNVKEVLPIQRFDFIDGAEKGRYKVQSAGACIIIFDNSHSWITSKEVEYCITVTKPQYQSIY